MKSLSVGTLFVPNIAMKITDENGKRLGIDREGEIGVKPTFEFLVSFLMFSWSID
jgi:hypothetical protein